MSEGRDFLLCLIPAEDLLEFLLFLIRRFFFKIVNSAAEFQPQPRIHSTLPCEIFPEIPAE